MPVQIGKDTNGCYAKWGQEGEKYYYKCDDLNEMENAKDKALKQAIAINLNDSYNDYPKSVRENAARGVRLNEEVNNKCATQVGKIRAQQLAQGKPISFSTIKRMFSYLSRAKEYYNPNDTKACGTISYLLWGGEEALNWSERKIKQIETQEQQLKTLMKILKK